MKYLDISLRSKIIVAVIALLFITYIISLLYKNKMSASFALGWIIVTLIATSGIVFHPVLKFITFISGVRSGANTLTLYAFVFIFAVLIVFSIQLSALYSQNKKLSQQVALLRTKLEKIKPENARETQ